MGAEFFSIDPLPARPVGGRLQTTMGPRLRQVHRWTSICFTSTVAANFVAMVWGPPPAWITYSPLPPLLILMVTGLQMLGGRHLRAWRAPVPARSKG